MDTAAGAYFDSGGATIAEEPVAVPAAATSTTPDVESGEVDGNNQSGEGEVDEDDDLASILKKSKKVSPEEARGEKTFHGHGRSLNSSNDNNEQQDEIPERRVRVTFYKDGFTATWEEDEIKSKAVRRSGLETFDSRRKKELSQLPPLRTYESHKDFLATVNNQQVPEEFVGPWRVILVLDDQRPKPYPEEGGKSTGIPSFSGTGHSLGGGNSSFTGGNRTQSLNHRPTKGQKKFPNFFPAAVLYDILLWIILFLSKTLRLDWSETLTKRRKPLIDTTKPTTTISVKLASGNRTQATFNTTSLCSDVYRFVEYEMVQHLGCDLDAELPLFDLVAAYPPKLLLDDEKETLDVAGLMNAAITQRIKKQD
eukprot:CAMPEP_0185742294 /NCGR_PEP_ID=MMETSP1171-20130828/39407_1 /TAXON_ID=374046 /ORGANISM="Helicotheca tamensis, Strain CCMP826" /LENGTH=366 /DNA_ID=CAMNT_0028414307 /DNA_START=93 /DNA_END=1193 /DNA_ORIENTATION=-